MLIGFGIALTSTGWRWQRPYLQVLLMGLL